MREEEKEEIERKTWMKISILISIPVVAIVVYSILTGATRFVLYRRLVMVLSPIVTFFAGLIVGVKYVYNLKTLDFYTEEEVKELDDGVTGER